AAATRGDIEVVRGIRENLNLARGAVTTALSGIGAIQNNIDNIRDALIMAQSGQAAVPQLSKAVDEQMKAIHDTIDAADFSGTNLLKTGQDQTIISGLDRTGGGYSFETMTLGSAALDNRPLDLFLNGEGYLETGGQLVFEAENYYVAETGDGHFWENAAARPGFIRVDDQGPNNFWASEAAVANAPEVRYRATLQTPGTYYVWVRGVADANPRGNSDSIHIGLNGQRLTQDGGLTGFGAGPTWGRRDTYTGQAVQFDVNSAGVYDINIWAREDGVAIDKIILTQDPGYVPSGTGPAENQFVTPGVDYLMDPAEGKAHREAAGFIELIERVRPEEAAVNFRTALTLLDAAEAKLRRAASGLGATERRIIDQQEFLQQTEQGLEGAVGALVDAELDELSSRLQATQVREQLAALSLSINNGRKSLVLRLFG
ncbi:MAG: flagellin, partial [Pseudomonadota bacterium]